jgi:L,D-transpeptidase ErfK/SrfK
VGRHASHGCIRLYPEDIPVLFELVRVGTPVLVVREPVKVGTQGDRIYLEVHADEDITLDYARRATELVEARGLSGVVDAAKMQAAVAEKSGIPVEISR